MHWGEWRLRIGDWNLFLSEQSEAGQRLRLFDRLNSNLQIIISISNMNARYSRTTVQIFNSTTFCCAKKHPTQFARRFALFYVALYFTILDTCTYVLFASDCIAISSCDKNCSGNLDYTQKIIAKYWRSSRFRSSRPEM